MVSPRRNRAICYVLIFLTACAGIYVDWEIYAGELYAREYGASLLASALAAVVIDALTAVLSVLLLIFNNNHRTHWVLTRVAAHSLVLALIFVTNLAVGIAIAYQAARVASQDSDVIRDENYDPEEHGHSDGVDYLTYLRNMFLGLSAGMLFFHVILAGYIFLLIKFKAKQANVAPSENIQKLEKQADNDQIANASQMNSLKA